MDRDSLQRRRSFRDGQQGLLHRSVLVFGRKDIQLHFLLVGGSRHEDIPNDAVPKVSANHLAFLPHQYST
jgi:hypothetical protein